MALIDDLTTVVADLDTLKAVVEQAVTDLGATTPVVTPADSVLASVVSAATTAGLVEVFGADSLSSALEAAGYTVTAPATAIPVTDGTPPLDTPVA